MWASEWPEFHKTKNKKITEKKQETQNETEKKTKIKTKNQKIKTESEKRFAGKDVKSHFKLKIYLISTSWAKWARHHQQQQHRQRQQ